MNCLNDEFDEAKRIVAQSERLDLFAFAASIPVTALFFVAVFSPWGWVALLLSVVVAVVVAMSIA